MPKAKVVIKVLFRLWNSTALKVFILKVTVTEQKPSMFNIDSSKRRDLAQNVSEKNVMRDFRRSKVEYYNVAVWLFDLKSFDQNQDNTLYGCARYIKVIQTCISLEPTKKSTLHLTC